MFLASFHFSPAELTLEEITLFTVLWSWRHFNNLVFSVKSQEIFTDQDRSGNPENKSFYYNLMLLFLCFGHWLCFPRSDLHYGLDLNSQSHVSAVILRALLLNKYHAVLQKLLCGFAGVSLDNWRHRTVTAMCISLVENNKTWTIILLMWFWETRPVLVYYCGKRCLIITLVSLQLHY